MKTKKISIEVTIKEASTLYVAVDAWKRRMNSTPYEEWKGVQSKNAETLLHKIIKAGI